MHGCVHMQAKKNKIVNNLNLDILILTKDHFKTTLYPEKLVQSLTRRLKPI